MYILEWRNCFSAHKRVILVFYFPSCKATREINTNITLEWAQKQLDTRVNTLFYFLRDDKIDYENKDFHTLTLCLTHWVYVLLTSQSIVHDVTITRQLWRDHVDSDISLDIDFIHGRSCKNAKFHGLRMNQMALNQNSNHNYDVSDVPHL